MNGGRKERGSRKGRRRERGKEEGGREEGIPRYIVQINKKLMCKQIAH